VNHFKSLRQIEARLTVLARFTPAKSNIPVIIPAIFLRKVDGKARTAQINRTIGPTAAQFRPILTEKVGEKTDVP
jgi:hypothetical protein